MKNAVFCECNAVKDEKGLKANGILAFSFPQLRRKAVKDGESLHTPLSPSTC
jgi:hypothetical protein